MNVLDFNILIVEDEFAYADTLEELVEEVGCSVQGIAESAEEALLLIQKEIPDLILMDIGIKGNMDGIALAKHIKEKIQYIPIIFITAFGDENTFSKVKETGAYSFITKPFDKTVLKRNIELAVSKITTDENVFEDEDAGILAKDFLFIKVNGLIKKVMIADIASITLEDKHSVLFVNNKRYVVRKSLKEISELLDSKVFIQIHRSHIINARKIDSISLSNYEVFVEKRKIPIGRTYKDQLVSRIQLI